MPDSGRQGRAANSGQLIDARRYVLADQERFAALSGDFNPIHLDSDVARREIFGEVVVHGVHSFLRALDAWCERLRSDGVRDVALRELAVKFPNAVALERQVETFVVSTDGDRVHLTARAAELVVLDAKVRFEVNTGMNQTANPPESAANADLRPTPANPTLEQLAGQSGNTQLYVAPNVAREDYPSLVALVGLLSVGELLALTRVVGMEAPGLRSTLSGFRLEFRAGASDIGPLNWEVATTDSRFSLVKLALHGPCIAGEVDTFRRPEPQAQPDLPAVRGVVSPGEFEGQCALIIGGSRGLGEVTSRIVAAGGGHSLATYYRGRADAETLAEECRSVAGLGGALLFDVADPEPPLAELSAAGITPTHVYYFASPKIFVSKPVGFNPELFAAFARCYVQEFALLHQSLRSRWSEPMGIFYPSSTALDKPERQLAEYSAAKAAGEALCAQLDRFDRKLTMLVERLPRTATDQTLTLGPYPAANALDVMLPIVREFHRAG